MSSPYGLTTDSGGNLFIANYGSNSVIEVATGGGAVSTVATGLNGPSYLIVDSSNSAVPEPGAWALLVAGAFGGSALVRRYRR